MRRHLSYRIHTFVDSQSLAQQEYRCQQDQVVVPAEVATEIPGVRPKYHEDRTKDRKRADQCESLVLTAFDHAADDLKKTDAQKPVGAQLSSTVPDIWRKSLRLPNEIDGEPASSLDVRPHSDDADYVSYVRG